LVLRERGREIERERKRASECVVLGFGSWTLRSRASIGGGSMRSDGWVLAAVVAAWAPRG